MMSAMDDSVGGITKTVRAHANRDAPPASARPSGRLVCVAGDDIGRTFVLGTDPMIIGRSSSADIGVLGDDVSRSHAMVSWSADGGFAIEDLGSRNGTLVNGVRTSFHELRLGDRIQIGVSAIFVFARPDDLEDRARERQTLETLGRVTTRMVHDFKNILGTIASNADFCLEHAPDAELRASLEDIRRAAEAATELTRRLLPFARARESLRPQAVLLLHEIVDDAIAAVRAGLPAGVVLEVDVDARLQIVGDRADLQQILIEVLRNAGEAMAGGGRLSIAARARDLARPDALAMHLRTEGRHVELAIRDTGSGMDAVTRARIFEPFFTTKPGPRHLGLGLASTYGMVRDLGGSIDVESTPGRGTTFRLTLVAPRVRSRAAPTIGPPRPPGVDSSETELDAMP
jgi:signal transduction histidine kinase